ncbi:MAG: acyl-CoA reductase [Flavisolibacter sp.]
MNLQKRIELLVRLGNYMSGNETEWQEVKQRAGNYNPWFIPEFIDLAVENITSNFLQEKQLRVLISNYHLPEENHSPKKIGIVMAGNIPLVGFHDLLCVFLSGHIAMIKPSSKDEVLVKHIVNKMIEWQPESNELLFIHDRIPNCDAYIATGSNNSSRYFEYYFQKYPSIIRKNRTSVAILKGNETNVELEKLADDVLMHFGLGCRNVTQIFVPKNYDFVLLLNAFKKYSHLADHNKYKNNYDYNLAIHILNNTFYMTNESIILIEDASPFSPISQLNYQYYSDAEEIKSKLENDENIQCIVDNEKIPFGEAQCPAIHDFADGVNTMDFLMKLS